MTPAERALEYMRQGWGSRASVFMAVLDHFKVDLPMETKKWICLAIDPFHGPSASFYTEKGKFGITVCGALSGALSAFNMVFASPQMIPYEFWIEGMKEGGWVRKLIEENKPIEEKVKVFLQMCEKYGYGAHYEMTKRFYEKFGTTDCADLCASIGDPVSYECFKNCAKVVCWTAEMATEIIEEFKNNPTKFKIGSENSLWQAIRQTT